LLAAIAAQCSTDDAAYISVACNPELFDADKCVLSRSGLRAEQFRTKRYEQLKFEKANIGFLVDRLLVLVSVCSSMVLRSPDPGSMPSRLLIKYKYLP
jgi:hypothetical protein